LTADAAIDVRLPGKEEVAVCARVPGIGDRVAHEDNPLFVPYQWRDLLIIFVITSEGGPIVLAIVRLGHRRRHA
jgi:hypothetical protein